MLHDARPAQGFKPTDVGRHDFLRITAGHGLTLRDGEVVVLFDGGGGEVEARLAVRGKAVFAQLGEARAVERESPLRIVLVQALASGDKMDWVVQKAVELGAHAVQPVQAETGGTTPMAAIKCSGGSCSQLVVRSDTGAPVSRDRYTTVDRTEGGLLVEMVEPAALRVVWSALNTGTVRPGDATQARLDAIATQTLEQLPPHHRH